MPLARDDNFLIQRAGTFYRVTGADVGALALGTLVEVDLGTPAKRSGKFVLTAGLSGLTVGTPVDFRLAPGPFTGKGSTSQDESQLYEITVTAKVTATNAITAFWSSRHRVRGNVKFYYLIGG